MISLLLASSLTFGQVRMPWQTESRGVPQCTSLESVQLAREARWQDLLDWNARMLAQIGPQLNDDSIYRVWVCLQSDRGVLLGRLRRHAEAIALFDELLPAARGRLGPAHPDVMSAEFLGASSYGSAGRREQQIRMLEDLRPRTATLYGPRSSEMASLLRNLALAHAWTDDFKTALLLNREVLSIREQQYRKETCPSTMNDCKANLGRAQQHLADSMRRNGLVREALPLAESGYWMQAEARGKFHPDTLDARLIIGSVYGDLGDLNKAIAIEREVVDGAMQYLGFDHEITKKARGNLAYTYSLQRAIK